MRLFLIATTCLLAGCTSLGDGPVAPAFDQAANAVNTERRGAVEVIVKTNHPTLLAEIAAGGGPVLTRAMDTAGVPAGDRAARILQMQGDLPVYRNNLEALTTALLLYGG